MGFIHHIVYFCFLIFSAISAHGASAYPIATVYDFDPKCDKHYLSFHRLGSSIQENVILNSMDFDGNPDAFVGNLNHFFVAFGSDVYEYAFFDDGASCDVQEVPLALKGGLFNDHYNEEAYKITSLKVHNNHLLGLMKGGAIFKKNLTFGAVCAAPLPLGSLLDIYVHGDYALFPHASNGSIFFLNHTEWRPISMYQPENPSKDSSLYCRDMVFHKDNAYVLYNSVVKSFHVTSTGLVLLDEYSHASTARHIIADEKGIYLLDNDKIFYLGSDAKDNSFEKYHAFSESFAFDRVFHRENEVFLCLSSATRRFSFDNFVNLQKGETLTLSCALPDGGRVLHIQ